MKAKENALRIIRFERPERVMIAPPTYDLHYRGANHQGFAGGGHDSPVGAKWIDIWGTGWHKELEGVMGFPRLNPLAEISALKDYQWPDPDDERIYGQIYRLATERHEEDCFLAGSHRDTLWEKAYMLVGMESFMVYFHTEPDFVRQVLHRIMDFQLGIARHYLQLGVELVHFTDDLGTQEGPLLGPRIVEEFLFPEYERLFRLYRERKVLIHFHSCGNIQWMLDTFMRLGVDILNPVQATANDLGRVRSVTQGRMALHGGLSSRTVMEGPIERIVAEAEERIWQLGQRGGYFCAPDQHLPYPEAHTAALEKAIEEHGVYPLRAPRDQ